MATPSSRSASQYQRRVLGLGVLAAVLLLVIGAPFFNNRVEDDLEQRVPEELSAVGFDGISASFSGQDGTLRCAAPLDDPERATEAAYDVWGVRAIELDRSCRVNRAPTVETTTTLASAEVDVVGNTTVVDAADSEPQDSAAVVPVQTSVPPDFETVADIVATNPQLSLLSVLIQEADLADLVAGENMITLFAPTDAAFDALPADAVAKLRAEPELLQRVLSHHAVVGLLARSDLVDGPLTTLGGGTLDIVSDDSSVTVSGAAIVTPDVAAGDGVVHMIDQVLIPDDVDLTVAGQFAPVTALFEGGSVTLSGTVASEVERAVLTAAVDAAPSSLEIDDQLTVNPDSGLDAATTASLAELVAAMPVHLVNGVSGFDGAQLYVSGTHPTDADRDAVTLLAESVGASVDLQPQPEATDADATELEAELNAYVAANPILFEPGSSVLTESSIAIVDRLAVLAQQFAGVTITVEGHTDSDGDAAENQQLSQFRALVVRQALIDGGLPETSITAIGFGSDRPVLVDGVEDKQASRRVEFRVVTTS